MLIYKQIPLIISEIGAIEKTRKGQGISYAFRGIDDIYFALQPLLAKHKVFFAPNVLKQERETMETKSGGLMTYTILTVEYSFYAEDGSHFKLVTVGEAMDTSDKSSNKAMSAALKYATLQLFCIPTQEDKDTELHDHQAIAPKPPSKPVAAISPPAHTGEYRIGFGKFKGQLIGQVPFDDLFNYATWLRQKAHEEKKEIKGEVLEFLERVEAL